MPLFIQRQTVFNHKYWKLQGTFINGGADVNVFVCTDVLTDDVNTGASVLGGIEVTNISDIGIVTLGIDTSVLVGGDLLTVNVGVDRTALVTIKYFCLSSSSAVVVVNKRK
uniref:Uncharacterized protein n=1 Tax=Setaria digitata TaxID=48799 RepID=A0A915PM26_9BILA